MHVAPRKCPVCAQQLLLTRLRCSSCGTGIEGSFVTTRSALLRLAEEDVAFVELFVRVRGNIREVEKALGVSYPTVRGMLDSINEKLRAPDSPFDEQGLPDDGHRLEVIRRLERGELTADQAIDLLS